MIKLKEVRNKEDISIGDVVVFTPNDIDYVSRVDCIDGNNAWIIQDSTLGLTETDPYKIEIDKEIESGNLMVFYVEE